MKSYARYSESEIMDRLEDSLLPNYFTTQVFNAVDVLGTHYDKLILYKERSGQVVAKKGYVSKNTGSYDQIIFYQKGNGRNIYRVGFMSNKNQFGTHYESIIFFQNDMGKNLAILSSSGKYIFYQNGIFKNIAAQDDTNFLDGPLRPIAANDFSQLFEQFMDLVLNN